MLDAKAYTQVSYIIQNMSEALREKIPEELIEVIEKNKDDEYKIDIENIEDLELLNDTNKILSVIYTDYIADEEEKMIIRNKERIIERQKEEEKSKKYDVNVFYKKQEQNNNTKIQETNLIVKKETWYQKLIKKIFNLLKKHF